MQMLIFAITLSFPTVIDVIIIIVVVLMFMSTFVIADLHFVVCTQAMVSQDVTQPLQSIVKPQIICH